jgi:hypothetical protein
MSLPIGARRGKPIRRYHVETRCTAVELAREQGIDRTGAALCIPPMTVYGWCRAMGVRLVLGPKSRPAERVRPTVTVLVVGRENDGCPPHHWMIEGYLETCCKCEAVRRLPRGF